MTAIPDNEEVGAQALQKLEVLQQETFGQVLETEVGNVF